MVLSTIALLVFLASFFILFSEELKSLAKKLKGNDKAVFFGVTFFISMLALCYEEYLDVLVLQLKSFMLYLITNFLHLFHSLKLWQIELGEVIILTASAFIPIVIGEILSKLSFIKKLSIDINKIFFNIAAFSWVICSVTLFVKS